jgi:hypothetical protein
VKRRKASQQGGVPVLAMPRSQCCINLCDTQTQQQQRLIGELPAVEQRERSSDSSSSSSSTGGGSTTSCGEPAVWLKALVLLITTNLRLLQACIMLWVKQLWWNAQSNAAVAYLHQCCCVALYGCARLSLHVVSVRCQHLHTTVVRIVHRSEASAVTPNSIATRASSSAISRKKTMRQHDHSTVPSFCLFPGCLHVCPSTSHAH